MKADGNGVRRCNYQFGGCDVFQEVCEKGGAVTGKTVLVVEDNYLNLKLVRDILELDGTNVLEAETAETGIELARRHKPDVILMDIELPGMDGLSATRVICGDPELNTIPVIAMTAYAMEEDRRKAQTAGCCGYITKPINIKSFQKTVNRYLSRAEAPAASGNEQNPPAKQLIGACGHRILIVDDDALNVKLLEAQLSSKGYHVVTALDGSAALERVQQERPDLILLDIMMPGIDGYEVTERLKADDDTRCIPIILVTALTGEEEKKKGLEAGADEFINKPINYPELEARVFSLLRLKEYQEQLGTRRRSEKMMVNALSDAVDTVELDGRLPTIMVVEDDTDGARLLIDYLKVMPCRIETAGSGEDALRLLSLQTVDIMILDVMLPCMDGFEVCRIVKGSEDTFPVQVVMITNLADTSSKLQGIEAGTDDFLVKPVDRNEFCAHIKSLIKKKAYLDQLRSRVDNALHAAITDKLTGVYNHGYLKHFLDLEYKRCKRHRHNLSLLMIDVDDFKVINDRYGHQCGDRFLKRIARILEENIREIDLVARYGGEEFAVVLPYADIDTAVLIAKRLLRAVSDYSEIDSVPEVRLTVSIGISLSPEDTVSSDVLIRTADLALYAAKKRGKNRYCVFAETDMQKTCGNQ